MAANSGIWTAAVVSQIALAPLAGLLVVTGGYGPAFLLNAVSFVVSALVLVGLKAPARVAPVERRLWRDAASGVGTLVGSPLLRGLAAGQLLAALSAGATSALLVVLAQDHLGLDQSGYGLLLGAIGLGAAIGPLLLTRPVRDPLRPVFVFGPFLMRAVVDAVLASVTALAGALAALVGYGLGTSTGAVTFNSLLQAQTEEATRGRVLAGFDLLWQVGRLVSLVLGGVVADAWGIRAVYYLGAVLLVAAAGAGWRGLRAHRRLGD